MNRVTQQLIFKILEELRSTLSVMSEKELSPREFIDIAITNFLGLDSEEYSDIVFEDIEKYIITPIVSDRSKKSNPSLQIPTEILEFVKIVKF